MYTKGEWKYLAGYIMDEHNNTICDMYTLGSGDEEYDQRNLEANAHLIASAPDLYEALKELTNQYLANQGTDSEFVVCITPEGIPEYWQKVKQALAKAEGK